MRTLKPKDYERLRDLSYRINQLRRCQVKFQPDHVEALGRVVAILKPKPSTTVEAGPPPGFGKLS